LSLLAVVVVGPTVLPVVVLGVIAVTCLVKTLAVVLRLRLLQICLSVLIP
jgi:hypothetical protein